MSMRRAKGQWGDGINPKQVDHVQ
ncbi:protein of unknown function [Ralstonia solanacearum CFBP2957]|nr:protein of unknown function [Ralstonia solanacearum CFBP2957]